VRHSPGCPDGVQGSQVVPNSAWGTGGLRGTDDPPPQPAAASTTTAASTAHNRGQRRELGSPDAARAERMPAIVTTFCRTQVATYRAQPHPARVIGSPGNYGSATGQQARGPNVPLLVPRLPANSSDRPANPGPTRALTAWATPADLCTRLTAVPGLLRASLKRLGQQRAVSVRRSTRRSNGEPGRRGRSLGIYHATPHRHHSHDPEGFSVNTTENSSGSRSAVPAGRSASRTPAAW
jgi:hypothetical protein